ncbi:MAG: glycosyltransferase family 2 protein, partial [Bacteroidia bacterium]
MKVAVVIPCFNEEPNIARVIREVNSCNTGQTYQLVAVVVNDKSTDLTHQLASNEKCVLLDLPVNLGIGGAVQTGFKYAFENNFDIALQLDGDGQHPAGEIEKIITPILSGDADVVIGSRFIERTGFQSSAVRRIGITFLEHLIKRFVHQNIRDCTSGFRALNKKAVGIVATDYPDDYPEPVSIITFHKHK